MKNTMTEATIQILHLLLSIVVTAPVLHLDTSWLNTDASLNTAREGATKKERKRLPQQQEVHVPFQKQTE